MARIKVKVSKAALIARINRRLRPDWAKLYKSRSPRYWSDLGDYYVVNFIKNSVVATHVNPEEYAREIGVLMDYEEAEEL